MNAGTTVVNRQWLLRQNSKDVATEDDFYFNEGDVPKPAEGDILVEVLYFGFDAIQQFWISNTEAGMSPVNPGEPMRCTGLGRVIESNDPNYQPGDVVEGIMTWQDYSLVRADGPMPLRLVDEADLPLSYNVGVLGSGGLTAYFGMFNGLNIKADDVLLVSAATGATGSVACQIGKIMGATVIGIAGGSEKCEWIKEHAGCDYALDYRDPSYLALLAKIAPNGVTAYFDNVGGDMLDNVILQMAPDGRILICGAMSQGYTDMNMVGPTNYMFIAIKELTVKGVSLFKHANEFPEATRKLQDWVKSGQLKVSEDMHSGFMNAPKLLSTIFTGKPPGKLVLEVDKAIS